MMMVLSPEIKTEKKTQVLLLELKVAKLLTKLKMKMTKVIMVKNKTKKMAMNKTMEKMGMVNKTIKNRT